MTGLSILYTQQATEEKEWATVPDRDKTSRLREVYWARKVEKEIEKKSSFQMQLYWRPDRGEMGRRPDHPGDGFIYMVRMYPEAEGNFEWLEVTEVFTTVSPEQIEGAMKARNGLRQNQPVDFDEFRRDLSLGRPSQAAQRSAADKVIEQINKKLTKPSYNELVEKYGYGTLIVGMPLWFATPPDDLLRVKNALDDFYTRTRLGLKEVTRKTLRKKDCPFKQVIVIWDTTPEAIKVWEMNKSADYENAANTSLSMLGILSESLEDVIAETTIAESEMPSMCFRIPMKVNKQKKGIGPYPGFVQVLGKMAKKMKDKEKQEGMKEKLKQRIILGLCKLFCFVKIYGMDGLTRRIARKMSVAHFLKVQMAEQQALRLYRESIKRNDL